MRPGLFTESLIILAAAHCALSATYSLSSSLTGQDFVDAFTWESNPDPNWGVVYVRRLLMAFTLFDMRRRRNYVNFTTAQADGLVSVNGNQVTLSADSTTVLNSSGPGRNSFDLVSNNEYTTHVAMYVPLPSQHCQANLNVSQF